MAKKVTMTDIAKACGVSQTLVSFVLNGVTNKGISEETKNKVMKTAHKLGYFSGKPMLAAVATNNTPAVFFVSDSNDTVCNKLFNALCKYLSANETELVHLGNVDSKNVKKITEKLRNNLQRIHKIVYVTDAFTGTESVFLKKLQDTPQLSEKLFLVSKCNLPSANIKLCDFALAESATAYMNELGYNSVAYLSEGKTPGYNGYISCIERLKMHDYSVNLEEAFNYRRRFDAIVVEGGALAIKLYLYFAANKLLDFDKIPVICTGDDSLCDILPVSLTTTDFDYDALAASIVDEKACEDIIEISLRDSHEPESTSGSSNSDSVWLL